jgi:Pectate lyase superfamily protein
VSKKRTPNPNSDSDNWGSILNAHLSQTKNPLNGALNYWTIASRPNNLSDDDEGKTGVNLDTGLIEIWDGYKWITLTLSSGINVWATVNRPSSVGSKDIGRKGINSDTGLIEQWNGIAWVELTRNTNIASGNFIIFNQFPQRPSNLTVSDIGKLYFYSQTGNFHQWTGSAWQILNTSSINVKDYGAIGDGVTDDTLSIQSCIALARSSAQTAKIFFQAGKYRITSTLNFTTPNNTAPINSAVHVEFDKRSSLNQQNTFLIGETGNSPVIETTGSYGVTLDNVAIYSGTINPSKIGVLHARQAFGGAFRHLYRNLTIHLNSDPSANGGFGTVALVNISAEEQVYENLELTANICYIHSTSYTVRRINSDYTGIISYNFLSSFGIPLANAVTATVVKFSGLCRFESLDWIGPIVLLHNPNNDFNISSIDFGNTFMIKKYPNGTTVTGIYDYAFEIFNCRFLKHFGQIEGCGRYMMLHGALDFCDIAIYDFGDTPVLNPTLSYIDQQSYFWLWPLPYMQHTIENTKINFYNGTPSIPLFRWKDDTPTALNSCPYLISNLELKTNSVYVQDIISQGVIKTMINCKVYFGQVIFDYNKNEVRTKISKNIFKFNALPTNIVNINLPVITSQSGISGVCKIEGAIANENSTSASVLYFDSVFSFVRNQPGYYVGFSNVQTNIISVVNLTNNFQLNSIAISYAISSNMISVFALPQGSGNLLDDVNLTATVHVNYSPPTKEALQLIFP